MQFCMVCYTGESFDYEANTSKSLQPPQHRRRTVAQIGEFAVKVIAIIAAALGVLSCATTSRFGTAEASISTYADILQQTLDLDTLQSHFYRQSDGTAYPLTIADDVLANRAGIPSVTKFGQPVTFITKTLADSAKLPAYFWVIDYQQFGDDARIQLEDPVRHILLGVAYKRTASGWRVETVFLER